MNTADYISDLLYRYDCVIVPEFGGFVTNKIGAKVNGYTHTFSPPTKQITFNTHLKHNDGLLANYIASSENISFEKANSKINAAVNSWNQELKTTPIFLKNVGDLSLNKDHQIVFNPSTTTNYLTSSFGFNTIESSAVKRFSEKVIPIIAAKKEKTGVPVFIKYAATAAILLTVGILGWNNYQESQHKEFLSHQEKALEQKIQTATFVISKPLPTIDLNVTKKVTKPFHIIAGAFQFPENATKKLNELKAKGFDAEILGVNKWGLIQVAFKSYANRSEAFSNLSKIRKSISKDAWILVKKFN
jgi:hypothetical protein